MRDTLEVGEDSAARRIAVLSRPGNGPAVIWCGGFRSDMRATKAEALDAWAARQGRAFVRFDYSGHGESSGSFTDGTISRWLEDASAVIDHVAGPPLIVGSSMGAWIATLATLRSREGGRPGPHGLVLIAPALDFTERLMWDVFSPEVRRTIEMEGIHLQTSAYSDVPYPITRALIEDGRRHLLLGATIETECPVHIIQGMRDEDVPWQHALRIVEHLPAENVQVTLVKDGDHRLSRPEDLDRLIRIIEDLSR